MNTNAEKEKDRATAKVTDEVIRQTTRTTKKLSKPKLQLIETRTRAHEHLDRATGMRCKDTGGYETKFLAETGRINRTKEYITFFYNFLLKPEKACYVTA